MSAFVGTGNGFVTTWYDQSGNSREATQTTAGNQPKIVSNGVVNIFNSKPCVKFDGADDYIESPYWIGTSNELYFVTQTTDNAFLFPRGQTDFGFVAEQGSTSTQISVYWTTQPQLYVNSALTSPVNRHDVYNLLNGYKLSVHKGANISTNFTYLRFGSFIQNGTFDFNGNLFEWIIYPTLQSSQSSIESNINSYYSIYPNPTSVWNLLNAVYSADTTALSSLKTSLVASYNGESNANDSFGTNNGTAVGGLTYGTGKIGNAFTFNGTNAYATIPDGSFNLTSDFSISFWYYHTATGAQRILYNVAIQTTPTNISKGWEVGMGTIGASNTINFSIAKGITSTYTVWEFTTTTMTLNTWHHVVINRQASTNTFCWINGVAQSYTLRGSGTDITYNPTYHTTQPVSIGCYRFLNGTTGEFMKSGSKLDELNLWNRQLTSTEIAELYNSGNGAQYITDSFYKPTTNNALGTNNGTAQGGLTYGVGKVGTAFQFNGTNASVRFPASSMNFTGDFSISGWVNLSSVYNGTYEATLIVNVTAPSWFINPKGFWVRIVGNSVNFDIWNGTTGVGCNWDDSTGSIVKANSGWIHIVATRKSSTGSKLYVNGVLKASNTSTINPTYNSLYQTPNMGSRYILNSSGSVVNSSVFAPDGTKMDGLSVWQKELTQADVTELYNSGNGKQYPN